MEGTVTISLAQFKRMESAELALNDKTNNGILVYCDFTHLDHRRYYLMLNKDEVINKLNEEINKLKNENQALIQEKYNDKFSYKKAWWRF